MKHTAVKGMHDILPPDSARWAVLEAKARHVFSRCGYAEIRTPIVEKTPLFLRSVGEQTDMVQKEMYSFVDQGDEALTLRPEGTAAVVRAYTQHGVYQQDQVAKYFYAGPYFRRERPQKGRYRQFHQLGVELFGAAHSFADAEVMAMLMRFLEAVGVRDVRLEVNSLGCKQCRPKYYDTMREFLASVAEQLCENCTNRMATNPMRLFDCKNTQCQTALTEAPTVQDYWCGECGEHFDQVGAGLDALGVTYWTNHRIVRGLDYYVRTAFEVVTHDLGAQSALCGGGRYDGLVKSLGGPDVPGIGFGLGIERLLLLLEQQGASLVTQEATNIYVAALGDDARVAMLPVMDELRRAGLRVQWDFDGRSLKAQMKRADRAEATHTVIVGESELADGKVIIRNMSTKAQDDVVLAKVVDFFT